MAGFLNGRGALRAASVEVAVLVAVLATGSNGGTVDIVEQRITHPKKLDELYGRLPEGARAAIARRDAQ